MLELSSAVLETNPFNPDHVLRDMKELGPCFPLGYILKRITQYNGCMCSDVVLQERVLRAQVDSGDSYSAGESSRDP
jgi:hypothetical protein